MAQLHSAESLTAESAVSLWVHMLPKAVEVIGSDLGEAGRKLRKKLPDIKSMFQNLLAAANQTEGLEHCETLIAQLLACENGSIRDPDADTNAGELLKAIMTAVADLSFEKQVQFFGAFYGLQKENLQELLNSWKPWCWAMPMDHHGVSCDGCGSAPLPGLRFKCTSCEDYDLCSSCFLKKQSLNDGKCAGHHFNMIPVDWANMWWKKKDHGMHEGWAACKHAWKMWMKGSCEEGKGKGKGKFKGKCKGKRAATEADAASTGVDFEPQNKCPRISDDSGKSMKCARPECNFKCTWHPTHCCHACAHGGSHGPKCERQQFKEHDTGSPLSDLEPSAPPQEPEAASESAEDFAKKLEEMGFGSSSEMQSVLDTCGGNLSRALELLTI